MEWEGQHPSAPSTPNSFSSQSTGNNHARTDKIPTLKQLSPCPSVTALSKLSDDDLRRKGKEDLVVMIRRMEADYKAMLGEHGNVVNDVNRRYQIFILETRNLKEVNQKLQDDNQELRDLCCFLDDDRQRGRKLAREWQRFGRYTASVMRSEVAVYQEKLRELEERQSELVTENMELKELCLFLDQERTRVTGDRDEGDGSSNGTTTGLEDGIISSEANGPNGSILTTNVTPSSGSSNYLRELEQKVLKLEEEKRILAQRVNRNNAEGPDGSHLSSNDTTLIQDNGLSSVMGDELLHGSGSGLTSTSKSLDAKKPDAVVHAMKVLQVHEELEKTPTQDENWDDTEKAILREMCNVVWRKLGDVGDVGSFNESSDSILDPLPSVPNSALGPGIQGQTQSFSLQQPQPQMASTPMSSATKLSSSSHPSDTLANPLVNQKHPESQPHLSPTRPSQPMNQTQYQAQPKKSWLPQADQRIDMYSSAAKDKVVTADLRPVSPLKKRGMDRVVDDDYERQPKPNQPMSNQHQEFHPHPYSAPQKQFQYSAPEDGKIPPHFLPHRRQNPMQYSGPQQQPMQHTGPQHQWPQNKPTQHMQPQHTPHPHGQGKTFTSQSHDQPSQFHNMPRSSSSSSTPTFIPTHNNSNPSYSYPNQQLLTSSQQYPHHPVRLLDAPGVHQPNSKPEPRGGSKDDHYSSQKPQKSNAHHPQMMYQRRDDIRSEPNISQSAVGNANRGYLENQNVRGARPVMEPGQGQRQEHLSNPPHSRYASDSSQGQQGLSSLPSSRSAQVHYQDSAPSHHLAGNIQTGGFSAYPPTSAVKTQHPSARSTQPIQKTPVMARAQPRRANTGNVKAPQRHTAGMHHYNDYDSDSL